MPSISKIYIINISMFIQVHKAYLYKRTLNWQSYYSFFIILWYLWYLYVFKETYEKNIHYVNGRLFKVLRSNDYIYDTNVEKN